MSISSTLNNALSGLTAATRMAEVVSSNVANALTEGYGRRTVDLSSASVDGFGAGVRIDGLTRHVNRALLADRRAADSVLSGHSATANALYRLEQIAGTIGSSTTIASRIEALEKAMISASADPSSEVRLNTVGDRLQDVATAFRDGEAGIRQLRQEADRGILDQVETLNTSLSQVQGLNDDIAFALNNGRDATALIDQRQLVVDTIARIVPVREIDRQSGQIALVTKSGAVLLDGFVAKIEFNSAATITPDMTLASGALSGVTVDGRSAADGVGRLDGGTLAATFALRDRTLVDAQDDLDAAARDLLERFQDPANDATLAAGDVGLFTDAGFVFDPANTVGVSARIAVNATVLPSQGGELFRLRDGVNAAAAGPVGSATQINAWLDGLEEARLPSNGGIATSASGLAGRFVTHVGAARVAADQQVSFATARFSALREAELADGVDTDQEMQNLLRIEQAYAANARVIETVDLMIRQLMEL